MKRTLIVLVAALALLGLILMKKNSTEKSMQRDRFVLDSAWKADVAFLTVAKKPDTAFLEKKDGKWVVAKGGFAVDTAKLNKVLGHVFKLQDKERVSMSKERLAEYGLDSAEAKHLNVRGAAGKSAQVAIGKTSGADFSSTYWKWEDKDPIYRTPGNFSWDIPTKDDDWKERKLFSAAAKDLKFLEVTWRDSSGTAYGYKLEALTDTTWKMLAPQDSNRVNKVLANEMAARFSDMTIDEFPAAKDSNLAKVKLDTPMVWVKAGLKNGTTLEIKATKAMDGYVYARHPVRPDTVKLSAWRFDAFKKKPFELLEAPPAPKPDSGNAAAGQPKEGSANGIQIEPARAGVPAKTAASAPTLQAKPAAPSPLKAETAKPAAK